MERQVIVMEARVVLGSDDAFKRAKDALVWLWNHRDGDLHEIEIKEWKKTRSTQANNFYWGCVNSPLAEHLGYTSAEMHNEYLGAIYGWKTVRSMDGQERQIPNRRTTEPEKMSVKDFNLFIEQCIRIAAELGITIDQSGWTK